MPLIEVRRIIRLRLTFERLVPLLGYHHILMIFIILAIILLSLLLAGCSSSSPLIPSIFLINLFYNHYAPVYSTAQVDPEAARAIGNIVANAMLEARVGYFGICINPDGGSWLCSNNASSLAAQVSVDQDPLNLIWVSDTFRDSIVFPYLLIVAILLATIVLVMLATFPTYNSEEERMPSRFVSQIALAIIFISAIFVLVSVLWQVRISQQKSATIAENLGNGSIQTGVGVTALVLGWFGFALLILVTIGLLVMILSRNLVDKQIVDDDE
ncbi:hypothetical protein TWF191_001516 [Orbilia oligospora]|uniref:Uncharacterized protein n=1 Tax=Orbilia oligospora TaxID=2813651 RepID=A0A7C8QCY7_ORBOL|nr:hypothetical protein TWF191_001516 [Orbilia oligospora]